MCGGMGDTKLKIIFFRKMVHPLGNTLKGCTHSKWIYIVCAISWLSSAFQN